MIKLLIFSASPTYKETRDDAMLNYLDGQVYGTMGQDVASVCKIKYQLLVIDYCFKVGIFGFGKNGDFRHCG